MSARTMSDDGSESPEKTSVDSVRKTTKQLWSEARPCIDGPLPATPSRLTETTRTAVCNVGSLRRPLPRLPKNFTTRRIAFT